MSRLWEMWLSVTIVGALATLTRGQGYHADLTDYDSISFDLRRHWASSLPPLPQVCCVCWLSFPHHAVLH